MRSSPGGKHGGESVNEIRPGGDVSSAIIAAMLRLAPVLALFVLACAETKAAKSPAEASAETTDTEAAVAAVDSAEAEDDQPAPGEKASAPSAPATVNDAQEVLQLVIDDEALNPYLHLDKPDRFPLRIAGSALPAGVELTKATKPVIIVADPASEKKPVLVFTEIKIEGDDASVRYRYDVENVRGSSALKRREGRWVLLRSRVTEH